MQSSHENLLCFSFGEIKRATNDFSEQNYLGAGGRAKVYRGNICKDGFADVVVAVKRFHKESEITLQKDIDVLSSVHHAYIISFIGYCEEENEKILVFEYMERDSLHNYLFKIKDRNRLMVKKRLNLCINVADALIYLHSSTQIVHGNLRADNILLDDNMVAKISNFGLSRTLAGGPSTSQQITSHQGKDEFLAPECYEYNYKPHMKADVYAFGVVLLLLLCDWPKRQVILTTLPYIMKGELHRFFTKYVLDDSPLKCLTTCEKIIRDCLKYNPANRPSMHQVSDMLRIALNLQNEQIARRNHRSLPLLPITTEGRQSPMLYKRHKGDRISSWSNRSILHRRVSLRVIEWATNDFAMDNLLEEGAFWKSYRGRCIGGYCGLNGDVTVKRINESAHGKSLFKNELTILDGYDHVNINPAVAYCDEKGANIIIYQFMPNGSLYDYLYNDHYKAPHLTMKQRLNICMGVAQGLSFLHEEIGTDKYNLSTNNILLDHDLVPRLSGIGSMCTQFKDNKLIMDYSEQGTEGYTAPECYQPNYQSSLKADVYSFGMLLLEVLCQKPPWKSPVNLALQFTMKGELPRFKYEHLEINISRECSRACGNLIRDCLDMDPDKRPSMHNVMDELGLALTLQENYQIGKTISHQQSSHLNPSSSSSCQKFLLSDIKKATNNFSTCLGEGAFGKVYSGNMSGDSYSGLVAVKRMTMEPEQGIPAFNKEIELVTACVHVNIISLVGYCEEEDEKILLYEFMPNGSLYDYLFKKKSCTPHLTIEERLEICIGVAKGVDYLHSGTDYVIIHSDLKTDNILLDQNLVPKISDFGLSRTRHTGPFTSEQITNHIQGTAVYLAPECYEPNYKLSRKADVYAFGIVLLEVLCERPPWDNLVILALPFIGRGELPNFTPDYVARHISSRCSRAWEHLIMECLDTDPVKRPDMNQVITKLEEALKIEKKYSKDHLLPFIDPKVFSSGFDRAVLYHNGSGKARDILYILYCYAKRVDERNVSLDPIFRDQLQKIFGWRKYSLPQLFVGGKHIGGFDMIEKLHDSRDLECILDKVPNMDYLYYCDNCGSRRFVSCPKGVCKECNANGLVRCPKCCFWLTQC